MQPQKILSIFLMLTASVVIFAIAQLIKQMLAAYDLSSMYISFCAGFILFTPLVSLALHPLLFSKVKNSGKDRTSALIFNVGLVMVVQGLFFLIWITDAIALYSIYVDSNSFLAKAFDIKTKVGEDLSGVFFVFNLVLAWCFSLLSLFIGLLPCLIARLQNLGIVGNFVAAFKFFKQNKLIICGYALVLSATVLLTLLYVNYLFLVLFPLALTWIFIAISKLYLRQLAEN